MKKTSIFAALTAVALTLMPMAADAGKNDYGVINKMGMDITHLYVSAHDENDWGDDILGRDVLETGDECEIEFSPDDDRCVWDFKITDDNGKDWTVMNVDLCKYTKVTFTTKGNKVYWTAR